MKSFGKQSIAKPASSLFFPGASPRRFLDEKLLRGLRPGGRSTYSGITATVFGASGFLARSVVERLGNTGTRIVAPFRGDGDEVRHLKTMGDLGMINLVPFDIRNEETVRKAVSTP